MAVYYISNSRAVGQQDGSQSNPFSSLWAAKNATGYAGFWISDNTFRLWASDTFDDYVNQPDQISIGSKFVIEPWTNINNQSKKPILTRAKRNFIWTFDKVNNVWVSDALANIRYGGVILEDGVPLNWTIWINSRSSTAATMVAGCACFDNLTLQYFIKPRSGTSANHSYAACAGTQNFRHSHGGLFKIRAIEFQLSSQGILLGGGGFDVLTGGWSIEDVDVRYCGASVDSPNAVALGNGLEIMHNDGTNSTAYIKRTKVYDCFDSGISPQIFDNGIIKNIEIEDCEAHRCGLTGFEVSISSRSGTSINSVENVNIRRCLAKDCGKGFSGDRYGGTAIGYSFLSNDKSPNSHVTNCGIFDSVATGCIGYALALPHAGGIITATRNYFTSNGGGVIANPKSGFGPGVDYRITDNIIRNCTKVITFGSNGSGLTGSKMVASTNLIEFCETGILNQTNIGDSAIAKDNFIVSCGTGISSVGSGTFTADKNKLFGNNNPVAGIPLGTNFLYNNLPYYTGEQIP